MNIIHIPILGLCVSEPSTRQTVIKFVEELITRSPFTCELIYSYMAQEYLPDHPQSSNHILAKRRSCWNKDGYYTFNGNKQGDALHQLSNGWFLYTQMNCRGFASTLITRIEEALNSRGANIQIYAHLTGSSDRGPGIKYYSSEDVVRLNLIL